MVTVLMLAMLLGTATAPTTSPPVPSIFDAMKARDAGNFARCAALMLEIDSAKARLPTNGEMFAVECMAAAGRIDESFAYLRRQLAADRIDIDALQDQSRSELEVLRADPRWPVLLAELEHASAERRKDMDLPLRAELLARADRDQRARELLFAKPGAPADAKSWAPINAVDAANLAWLKQVVDRHGWPSPRLVGRDGAQAAWLLVQHADADPAFQHRCLDLMEHAGDIDPSNLALLTDRVLLAEGKPQRFGTQFQTGDDGIMRVRPLEDASGLDARRAAVGLPSMVDYKAKLSEMYGRVE